MNCALQTRIRSRATLRETIRRNGLVGQDVILREWSRIIGYRMLAACIGLMFVMSATHSDCGSIAREMTTYKSSW